MFIQEEENKKLQKELKRHKESVTTLREELTDAKHLLEQAESKLTVKTREWENLNKKLSSYTAEVRQSRDITTTLQATIDSLQNQLKVAEAEMRLVRTRRLAIDLESIINDMDDVEANGLNPILEGTEKDNAMKVLMAVKLAKKAIKERGEMEETLRETKIEFEALQRESKLRRSMMTSKGKENVEINPSRNAAPIIDLVEGKTESTLQENINGNVPMRKPHMIQNANPGVSIPKKFQALKRINTISDGLGGQKKTLFPSHHPN